MAKLLLRRHTELLFLVDDQQAQVFELEAGTENLVRADKDIYLSFLQSFLDVRYFLGGPQPADIVDRARESVQAGAESFEVLEGEDGSRYQHSHLFGIADGLEGGADGHLRLSEAYIAADEAVHRAAILHILLDRLCGTLLIGGVLIHEGRFQLFLEVVVGREGVAL